MVWLLFSISAPLLMLVSFILICIDGANWRKYYKFYIFSIFLLAYTYVPKGGQDLQTYLNMLPAYRNLSFIEALTFSDSGLFIQDIYLWIVAKSYCDGLLPAISTSVVYGVATYITGDYLSKMTDDEGHIGYYLLLQFLLLPSLSIISNVRNVMAFSLAVLAVYRDVVQQKKGIATLSLYILPCFLHSGAILIILSRLLVILFKKHKIPALFMVVVFPVIIDVAYKNISIFNGLSMLQYLIYKAYRYSSDEYGQTGFGLIVSTSNWYRFNFAINMLLAAVVLIFIIATLNQKRRSVTEEHDSDVIYEYGARSVSDFQTFVFLLCIIVISCVVFNAPHYWRAAVALKIVLPVALVEMMKVNSGRAKVCRVIVWIISFGCLYLMYSVSKSQSHVSEWMTSFMLYSPYRVLWDIFTKALFN